MEPLGFVFLLQSSKAFFFFLDFWDRDGGFPTPTPSINPETIKPGQLMTLGVFRVNVTKNKNIKENLNIADTDQKNQFILFTIRVNLEDEKR